MYNSISISLGEMVLKGKNRGVFEQKLNNQILKVIKEKGLHFYRDRGKVFVDTGFYMKEVIDDISNIFGIVNISPSIKVEATSDAIETKLVEYVSHLIEKKNIKTFKISCKRADKTFPVDSMTLNRHLGGIVLDNFDGLTVDVHSPDVVIYLDIRTYCYIFTERIKGAGGLPVGTNGEGLVLISGGIDSPVAAYMMAKRGVKIKCVTFHAYPFTSMRANEKVEALVDRLSIYCGSIDLYSINLLEIYKEIKQKCPDDESTIIARRFMMRIAGRIARWKGMDMLVTGESLGQVASQTSKSLGVVDASVDNLVLRPLIGMDKTDIIDIAQKIGTFDISILPFDDCCSVFSPAHPQTRPRLERIESSESKLDIEALIVEALKNLELKKIF
ncbi:MAG: tRNA uracil 4-sulfurtransferase ThiI [Eubacteriales bacterium]|nr:tRNA uracil 4-sulfurtransferase ThiI [Eubacteriales bacterium]